MQSTEKMGESVYILDWIESIYCICC